jgi:hypothetical protein
MPLRVCHGRPHAPPPFLLQEELVRACTIEQLQQLGLTAPQRPAVPKGLDKLAPAQRLLAVQVGP